MLKQFGLVIAVILAIIAIRAGMHTDSFHVERSITIRASAQKTFALVNDFRNFGRWSPWESLDPKMQRTISGPTSGPGAVYEWDGNRKAGAGRMEIVEATPPARIVVRIDFLRPIASTSVIEYSFQPIGDSTKVTWAMDGPSPFISKVMQVFVSMDKMIGGDFQRGLTGLKALAEQ